MTKTYLYIHRWHGIEQYTVKREVTPGTLNKWFNILIECVKLSVNEHPDDSYSIGILLGRTGIARWDYRDATLNVVFGVLRCLWDNQKLKTD